MSDEINKSDENSKGFEAPYSPTCPVSEISDEEESPIENGIYQDGLDSPSSPSDSPRTPACTRPRRLVFEDDEQDNLLVLVNTQDHYDAEQDGWVMIPTLEELIQDDNEEDEVSTNTKKRKL